MAEELQSVGTYAFLDFESTGFLDTKPKITELCIIAVHAVDMLGGGVYPRVTNKLNLCLNPMKPISAGASFVTGLYNDNLEHQHKFSAATVTLLNNFLEHLNQPVCLIAHNGNLFDYPLLAAELKRINQSLTLSLMCADSLEAFRSLDGLPRRYVPANQSPASKQSTPLQPTSSSSSVTPVNCMSITPSVPPCLKRKSHDREVASPSAVYKVQKGETEPSTVTGRPQASRIGNNTNAGKVRKKLFTEEAALDAEPTDDVEEVTVNDKELNDGKSKNEDLKGKEVPDRIEFFQSIGDDEILLALDEAEKEFFKSKDKDIKAENEKDKSYESGNAKASTSDDSNGKVITCEGHGEQSKTTVDDQSLTNGTSKQYDLNANCQSPNSDNVSRIDTGGRSSDLQNLSSSCVSDVLAGSGYIVMNKVRPAVPHEIGDADGTLDKKVSASDHVNDNSARETETSNNKTPVKTDVAGGNSIAVGGQVTPVRTKSYELVEIYRRIFGRTPSVAHHADDDCVALVKAAKCTPGFTEWVAKNMVPFSSIEAPTWATPRKK